MFNACWEPLTFDVPRIEAAVHAGWRRWIDTARGAPDDIGDDLGPPVEAPDYAVHAIAGGALRGAAGIALTTLGATARPARPAVDR
jgi:hypothetical protein